MPEQKTRQLKMKETVLLFYELLVAFKSDLREL